MTRDVSAGSAANVKVHVVQSSGSVLFDNFAKMTNEVDLNMKFRNLNSLTIIDSYFEHLEKSGMEVFNVPSVYVMHSEFHHCNPQFMIANSYVKNMTIVDCLMDEDAVHLLSNGSTKVTKLCTLSPLAMTSSSHDLIIGEECKNSIIGRWHQERQSTILTGVETTGAITLVLVSSAMLMTIVLVLYSWHRQGKLDAYL